MNTKYEELKIKLEKYKQEHLLKFWDELDEQEKDKLITAINDIDFDRMNELKDLIDKDIEIEKNITQATYIPTPEGDEESFFYESMHRKGEMLLKEGKVSAFVVAGGQGTRLGFDAPKGTFPFGPITNNSLFYYHFEKLKALQKKYNTEIPFLIMTSEMTHNETVQYIEENNYFGYNKYNVFIFQQGKMPAMDKEGKILLEEKYYPAFSPDGHGGSVFALNNSGVLDKIIDKGIEYIFYFQVDNNLIKICEPYFLGCHFNNNSDISLKVLEKSYPEEKMGVFVLNNGKPSIIEYSDLSEEEMYAKDNTGKLKYRLGSPAIHIFSVDFIKNFTNRYKNLPFHKAIKKVLYINEQGEKVEPTEPNGVKFEMFIFDILPYSTQDKVTAVETVREREFAPLKNKEGKDSIQTARQLYINECARLLETLGVNKLPKDENGNSKFKIEITPYLAIFKQELKKKVSDIVINKDTYID